MSKWPYILYTYMYISKLVVLIVGSGGRLYEQSLNCTFLTLQHSQWRRGIEADLQFNSRIILFNESINYTNSVILILDADNNEVQR